jgi:hypothetical protein
VSLGRRELDLQVVSKSSTEGSLLSPKASVSWMSANENGEQRPRRSSGASARRSDDVALQPGSGAARVDDVNVGPVLNHSLFLTATRTHRCSAVRPTAPCSDLSPALVSSRNTVPLSLVFISSPNPDSHPDLERPGAASGAPRECVDVVTDLVTASSSTSHPSPLVIFPHPAYIQAHDARRLATTLV